MKHGPNPDAIYPNEAIKSICFIKNVIICPNIVVGDYTYYSDINGAENFEEHVLTTMILSVISSLLANFALSQRG